MKKIDKINYYVELYLHTKNNWEIEEELSIKTALQFQLEWIYDVLQFRTEQMNINLTDLIKEREGGYNE